LGTFENPSGDCLLWALFWKPIVRLFTSFTFLNYINSPLFFGKVFFHGEGYALVLTKKWFGLHFGRLKKHLVTLTLTPRDKWSAKWLMTKWCFLRSKITTQNFPTYSHTNLSCLDLPNNWIWPMLRNWAKLNICNYNHRYLDAITT
jgi:hypothetical protein